MNLTIDRESGAYQDGEAKATDRRFTAFIHYSFGHGEIAIEEIDVNAPNETAARMITRAALARDYEPGGRIHRITERPAGVWYL